MEKRQEELVKLKSYIEGIDNELTMILQTLQWDRKHLLQNPGLVTCRYDSNHRVPPDKSEEHEKKCFLRQNGYSKDESLLPDPLDLESNTLVKLNKEDIKQIIDNAATSDTSFKKVYRKIVQRSEPLHPFCIVGCHKAEPLSLERLQMSYSADERRALHDAVVSAVPSCHNLADLALFSDADDKNSRVILSRQEILLQLRNMRRRRTKYRVAAKSRNYSDVLRDVIRSQMEHYNDGKSENESKESLDRNTDQKDTDNEKNYSRPAVNEYRSSHDGKIVPKPIKIKIEREDSTDRNRDYCRESSYREYTHESGSGDTRDKVNDRSGRDDRSRDRRYGDDLERTRKHGEYSRKRRHDDGTRERRHYYEKSGRHENRTDNEYRSDKRSKTSHRHKDHDPEYQAKKEPVLDDEPNNYYRHTSGETRHDDKRDKKKAHRHKDKKERRDRERSKERRRERHDEGGSERIHIKQEVEDSITRGDTNYEKEKTDRKRRSKNKKHDMSHRDANYDRTSDEVYDPYKKIKVEK